MVIRVVSVWVINLRRNAFMKKISFVHHVQGSGQLSWGGDGKFSAMDDTEGKKCPVHGRGALSAYTDD
ncbi:MAG: hypothetical protein FWF59_10395 [Turicibacter sp.]|nr:hypothetical protein [Turicibacter sp.]